MMMMTMMMMMMTTTSTIVHNVLVAAMLGSCEKSAVLGRCFARLSRVRIERKVSLLQVIYLHNILMKRQRSSLCGAALGRSPRQPLPNAAEVGPSQLSAIAAADDKQTRGKVAAKSPVLPTSGAFQAHTATRDLGAAARHDDAHDDDDDDDSSSWGDGSTTEEVVPNGNSLAPKSRAL